MITLRYKSWSRRKMAKTRSKRNAVPPIAKDKATISNKKQAKKPTRPAQGAAKSDIGTCFVRLRRTKLADASLPQALTLEEAKPAALRDQCVNTSASTVPPVKKSAQAPKLSPPVTRMGALKLRRSKITKVAHARPEPLTNEQSPTALRDQLGNPIASAGCAVQKQHARTPTLVKRTTVSDQVPNLKFQTSATNSGSKRIGTRGKENKVKALKQVESERQRLPILAEEHLPTSKRQKRGERTQQVSTCTGAGIIVESEKAAQDKHRIKRTAEQTNVTKGPEGGDNDISTASKSSQRNISAKNFANNNNAIEKILLSEEEDERTSKEKDVKSKASEKLSSASTMTAAKKAHKFFHRTAATAVKNKCNAKTRSQRSTIEGRIPGGNMYEFLSQSQSSDPGEHVDPAADVIQKLIAEGKVRVATRRKGTGRPIIKRIVKRVIKKRIASAKRPRVKKNMVEKTAPAIVEEDDFDFGASSLSPPNIPAAEEEEVEKNVVVGTSIITANNHNKLADGTFSHLARSVLLNQAGKNENVRKRSLMDQQRLLDVARKFVSTPVNRAKNASLRTANISPIEAPKLGAAKKNAVSGGASPWRVPDEAHLPSVFYFSKNSSQLPSFSSDFIPPTPRKKVQFEDSHKHDSSIPPLEYSKPEALEGSDVASTSAQAAANASLAQHISSFTSNDSDAENVPPLPHALAGTVDAVIDGNADIFNLRQQSNPRRTYSHRSPLKAINILEVVTLPPWHPTTSNSHAAEGGVKPAEYEKSSYTNDESNIEHLFGFDELIDHDESDEDAQSKLNEESLATSHVGTKDLRKKLRDLKKWRPAIENLLHEESKAMKPTRRIYDDDEDRPRQRRIKEMFCSTMINQQKTKARKMVDSDEDDSAEERNNGQRKNTNNAEAGLFSDPETTFNETQPRRTYGRQYKKKRKLRHNFVMFLDSDESGEEEVAEEDQSYEENKCDEKERKRARKQQRVVKKIEKANPELESFVHDFNEMCKEVEQYELIVE